MSPWLETIKTECNKHADPQRAIGMQAYMRDQFPFLGINSTTRKEILRPFFAKEARPKGDEARTVVRELWSWEEREYQYIAQELMAKEKRSFSESDLDLFTDLIEQKSWWDTVDFIASNLVGECFKNHPEFIEKQVKEWMTSENIWLQRTCLIYPLKWKGEFDVDLLSRCVLQLEGSKEFFINKAIGWILRQTSKYKPQLVKDFISSHNLAPLSIREASKYLD